MDNLTRWRMVLGSDEADGTETKLSGADAQMDAVLTALYECERKNKFEYADENKKGSHGKSQPQIARWLGDIRKYFPQSVAQVIQDDALKQPILKNKLLLDAEILEQAVPDVHLLATLLELGKAIPDETRETARFVVRKVVDELMQRLEQKTIQAVKGALNKSLRNRRPRYNEIDWNATIKKNLKNYQPKYKTIIPEIRIGLSRSNKRSLKEVILCLDQSGSMGTSVVYTGIFAAVLATLPTLKTQLIVFDTEVVNLTEDLKDPVDLLFGVQLGGGTDINKALNYCQSLITKPSDTILILISDLYEGGSNDAMQLRMQELVQNGVQCICILALNDDGAPSYDRINATFFSQLEIPVFACTPDIFPDMLATTIGRQDMKQWAGENKIVLKG